MRNTKKSLLFALIIAVIVFSIGVIYASSYKKRPSIIPPSSGEPRVILNRRVLPDKPVFMNSRTLLPMRAIFEGLSAEVEWNPETRRVTATKGDALIYIDIDSSTAFVNNIPITLDTPAILMEGRTFVPVRFVAESLGLSVIWDEDTQTVVIE